MHCRFSHIPAVSMAGAFGLLVSLSGCADDVVTGPRATTATALSVATAAISLPAVEPGDSATADTLAHAVALALSKPGVREQILEDLRDSPFAEHAIDLRSYLDGGRGRAVLAVAARQVGLPTERLLAMASVRGGLSLSMPISSDRPNWSGSDSIEVAGTPFTVREELAASHQPFGYTVRGNAVGAPLLTTMPRALLVVGPAEQSFGPDPEATRSAATKHSRGTITTFREERLAMYVPHASGGTGGGGGVTPYLVACDADGGSTGYCEPPPPNPPPGIDIPSGGTIYSCVPDGGIGGIADESQDHDRDGVYDYCENELAQAFSPQMQYTSDDCNYSNEPYHSVKYLISPIDNHPVIQIFYAISYHYDCGSPRPDCFISACDPHYGDSEFVVAEVSTEGSTDSRYWTLRFVTLSAHYGTRFNSTGTYAGSDVSYGYMNVYAAPLVWVSEGKHGNYRSQGVCDAGAEYYDNCDRPGARAQLDVRPEANLGSYDHQYNAYTVSRVGGQYTGTEHMWSTSLADGFLGWYPRAYGTGETPYGILLRNYGY